MKVFVLRDIYIRGVLCARGRTFLFAAATPAACVTVAAAGCMGNDFGNDAILPELIMIPFCVSFVLYSLTFPPFLGLEIRNSLLSSSLTFVSPL